MDSITARPRGCGTTLAYLRDVPLRRRMDAFATLVKNGDIEPDTDDYWALFELCLIPGDCATRLDG